MFIEKRCFAETPEENISLVAAVFLLVCSPKLLVKRRCHQTLDSNWVNVSFKYSVTWLLNGELET